jgi:uncharacterized repeat protein (TIGR03803 family)
MRKRGSMGKLNWVTKACGVFLLWAAGTAALPAQTFTTLFKFDGTDGSSPYAALVQGTDGKLYGTTSQGGTIGGKCGNLGCGTVFKITTSGTLQSLHSFHDNLPDGYFPIAGLVQGTDGKFYGTAQNGGANNDCDGGLGCGTVFSITADGTLTTLHGFDGTDGDFPTGTMVQGTDGKFYGTTVDGGACSNGTVFSITADGALTTLHSFGHNDGSGPYGGMVQGTDGKFYGTTDQGGANNGGTVFKITASGTLTTLLNFAGFKDGQDPEGGLIQGTNGEFYGTTPNGGELGGGTVFSVTVSTTLAALGDFDGTDGSGPFAGLVQGTDGNFYGTTEYGGDGDGSDGTVLKITPTGVLTSLYSFCSLPHCPDGIGPLGGLVQDTDGSLYGTTEYGGTGNDNWPVGCGTIFRLSVGLGPFVKTLPTTASVGASVSILGTDLTGATGVSFNGIPATFTVASPSKITTTVPVGATSGPVNVVTPGGTINSNIPFTVE